MSIKINLKVPHGNSFAHCEMEVPLEAIGVTFNEHDTANNQHRITEFTSKTVAAVLQEAENKAQAARTALIANGHVTAVKTEAGHRDDFHNGIHVFLHESTTDREMVFNIGRSQPLQKALVAFANRFGAPAYNLRLRAGWRLVTQYDTADTVSISVGSLGC